MDHLPAHITTKSQDRTNIALQNAKRFNERHPAGEGQASLFARDRVGYASPSPGAGQGYEPPSPDTQARNNIPGISSETMQALKAGKQLAHGPSSPGTPHSVATPKRGNMLSRMFKRGKDKRAVDTRTPEQKVQDSLAAAGRVRQGMASPAPAAAHTGVAGVGMVPGGWAGDLGDDDLGDTATMHTGATRRGENPHRTRNAAAAARAARAKSVGNKPRGINAALAGLGIDEQREEDDDDDGLGWMSGTVGDGETAAANPLGEETTDFDALYDDEDESESEEEDGLGWMNETVQ